LWHPPTRTLTVLMWRPHGRTIPAFTGMTTEATFHKVQTA
jgi:hypothetical protein